MWWKTVFETEWTTCLLPSHATGWERVMDAVDGDLVARNPVGIITASRSAGDCPLPLLPYLAVERSVDEFSGAWPETMQRAVVAGSLAVHKVKGTRPALVGALAPLGYAVKVVEWFEATTYQTPYTFRIKVTIAPDIAWSGLDRAVLLRTANAAKNAHTLMTGFDVERRQSGKVFVSAKIRRFRTIRVGQVPKPLTIRQSSFVFVGVVLRRSRTLRIAARQ